VKDLDAGISNIEAGDTVSYTITVDHAVGSSAGAFDVNVTDDIPDILENVTITALLNGVNVGPTGTGVIFLDGNGDIATMANALDLPNLADTLVITITGTVMDSASPGDVISNKMMIRATLKTQLNAMKMMTTQIVILQPMLLSPAV